MLPPTLDLAARVAALVPSGLDRGLAAAVGPAWCALDGGRRRAVAANRSALGARFPLSRPFSAYTAAFFTWLRLLRAEPAWVRARTSFEGLEGTDGLRAAAARHGAVLVAAHVGAWEWGAAALAAAGLPVVAVAAVQMNPAWSPALARAKRRLGVEVVGPEAAPHRLARALRSGAVVALLVDGDVATARAPGRMGALTALLPRGPSRLAARTGAALWAGRCARLPGGGVHHVRLQALAGGRGVPARHERPGREAALHAAVAAWLDATVREEPGAWCLFRPFFTGGPTAAGA
jgi:lauroyl/myristoyl acyltransferase